MFRINIPLVLVAITAASTSYAGVITGQVIVDGRSNIFGAGLLSPPGGNGILPLSIDIPAAALFVEFGAIGSISLDIFDPNTRPYYGPDGGDFPTTANGFTDIFSLGGISGLRFASNTFLAGVFLSDSLSTTAPARLNLNTGNFATLAPELQQTFFIGDGLTGTSGGIIQRFFIPTAATRLYLGMIDGFDPNTLTITGPPRFYNDNGGSFQAQYAITAVTVPEPSTLTVFGIGGLGLICSARRRKQPLL